MIGQNLMPPQRNTAPNCTTCTVRGRTEWCDLSKEHLDILQRAKSARNFLPGEPIYHEGAPCDGVHCIAEGMVGIRKLDEAGNSILLRLSHPGETLGYRSLLTGGDHRTTAEALAPSTICFIDQRTVWHLLKSAPAIGLRFLQHAAHDLDSAEEKALQSATLTVRGRLAHLLLVFRERYAIAEDEDGFELQLPLSRQDLAAMIGIRPESMSRTIRHLHDNGVAKFAGRRVHIPSVEVLLGELDAGKMG